MTYLGPRPERPELQKEIEKEVPEFGLRLQAKAGLTGYAQVYGKYNTTFYDKLLMWDMYNHREYEEANKVAEQLITIDSENVEARYVKALCLTRFDEDDEAKKILDNLLEENADNAARYYYALGRIQKKQGKYNKAIELYKTAILNRRRYLSPYRELAECYILMDNISDAKIAIENAKKIDESNVFVILLEARLLQKEDCADKAIELLEKGCWHMRI